MLLRKADTHSSGMRTVSFCVCSTTEKKKISMRIWDPAFHSSLRNSDIPDRSPNKFYNKHIGGLPHVLFISPDEIVDFYTFFVFFYEPHEDFDVESWPLLRESFVEFCFRVHSGCTQVLSSFPSFRNIGWDRDTAVS